MSKNVVIVEGHPDAGRRHYLHALADADAAGAAAAGHRVRRIDVAGLDFELLRSREEYENGAPVEAIRGAQETIDRADHLAIFYPLWLGEMPALLKGFLEQLLRPEFVLGPERDGFAPTGRFGAKTAHLVVTMGMSAGSYRRVFGAHGLKSFKCCLLNLCGFSAVTHQVIGAVGGLGPAKRAKWIEKIRDAGCRIT